ncbi:MAG: membrane protein insertase YidC [Fimbriimonadaceae bacterium]
MAQQPQKPNFMNIIMWSLMIFLGYNLFIAGPQKQNQQYEGKTTEQMLKSIRDLNIQVKEVSIAREVPPYLKKIENDPTLTFEQKLEKTMEARVLLCDTQLKAAVQRQDLQRVVPATDMMTNLSREFIKSPLWKQQFKVGKRTDLDATGTISPEELKAKIRTEASKLGRETPVWGFFPGYELIDFIVGLTGKIPAISYGVCCFLLALFVRGIVFPLSKKQMLWGRQMSQLTPLVNEIKEQYKPKDGKPLPMEKQQEMNQRVMGLYSEYGLNPMAGCWPAFLQMPLFFIIYQAMLHYRFEFEKGTFLWINESVGKATNGFLAANLGQKDYLLIVFYGISMIVTTLLTPVSDPTNAKQSRMIGLLMAVMFSIMMFFWPVPSAFVLYWVFTNILATAQSLWIYKLPLAPLTKKNTKPGGVIPQPGGLGKFGGQTTVKPSAEVKTGTPQMHKPKKKK